MKRSRNEPGNGRRRTCYRVQQVEIRIRDGHFKRHDTSELRQGAGGQRCGDGERDKDRSLFPSNEGERLHVRHERVAGEVSIQRWSWYG
ncbi:hypothetical protein [Butyricimonas virosa]|uniref:hypothetical protein n=1 Tax=Butyricimonas virosa TaxID=544645 RepID=UPI0015F44C0B|nr:hypothetical protein [Butyricimonas virosa]